jgi:hypothetical protein
VSGGIGLIVSDGGSNEREKQALCRTMVVHKLRIWKKVFQASNGAAHRSW